MKQYQKLLQSVTKNVYIPILQNTLCDNSGIHASDANIFVYIKTDTFNDTKIRNFDSIELDMTPSDFIATPENGIYQGRISFNKKTLLNAVKQLNPYIAKKDESREYLKGIHIESEETTRITATDSYKALQINIPNAFNSNTQKLNIFIPQKLMTVISKLDKLGTENIIIAQYENVTTIETGNILITHKPNGTFTLNVNSIFNVRDNETITNLNIDKHLSLSILRGLKSEIISFIDADTSMNQSRKDKEKKCIELEWIDNTVKYVYWSINQKTPFTRVIPCEGSINGRINLDDLIRIINDIDSDIINIDLSDLRKIKVSDSNKNIALLLRR